MSTSCRSSGRRRFVVTLLPLLWAPLLASCSVSLIAPYDSRTEEMVTQIQSELSAFHQELIYDSKAPACVYSKHMGFYRTTHADIANLRVRVGAIAKNAQTADQVEALEKGVGDLELIHRNRENQPPGDTQCMGIKAMENSFGGLEGIIRAILQLEMVKQRTL
ncbi:hypothetical protein Q9Q95_05345 [Sphingomonas sp. DG1-23]|uniref:hypothetical protein n=1 Tax=Sphingomonas sp. DG1-23 TaxID=3068316 RepID=UPI00273D62B9|nr:hypothetical protein [Sphingomonas sp. DG1-23]MDP5278343.1 hypothetical protein [Sphingomonas sp. DG1-23]